jgi:carboxylesterase
VEGEINLQNLDNVQVLEGAEEFKLGSGPVGALLVHGFTGSPQGMRGLGEYLAGRNVAVEGIRLPGHGTTWQDLNSRRSHEWTEAVEAGFEELAKDHDEVFIAALSFGAALALDFAARNPDRVAGIVSLAGFILTKDPRRHLSPVIKLLTKSLPGVGNDICDPDGKEICYDRIPTSATYDMLRFCNRARTALPKVTAPLLVIHSRNDHTAVPASGQFIYDNAGSEDKHIEWLERSYHVITLDHDRDTVFEKTFEFIKDHSKHAAELG